MLTLDYIIKKKYLTRAKELMSSLWNEEKDSYDKESIEYLISLIDLLLLDYKIDIREHVAQEFAVFYAVKETPTSRNAYLNVLRGVGGLD